MAKTKLPEGWAKHYYDNPFMDMYFAHVYHYYQHGRSICLRSVQRMPDQTHYETLPEDHLDWGFCSWCMVKRMRGSDVPEYLWEDQMYEQYRGKTYKVLDRSAQKDEPDVEHLP